MKKTAWILLSLAWILTLVLPLCGETVSDLSSSVAQPLTVTVEPFVSDGSVSAEDGVAEGQLPDDTEFKAEDLDESVVSVQVTPVEKTEEEAWDWIQSNVGEKSEIYKIYHVVAFDQEGDPASHEGAQITLTLPEDFTGDSLVVCFLKPDGSTEDVTVKVVNATVTFRSSGAPYYVLCTSYDNPPTTDRMTVPFCIAGVLSLAVLGSVLVLRRKSA